MGGGYEPEKAQRIWMVCKEGFRNPDKYRFAVMSRSWLVFEDND